MSYGIGDAMAESLTETIPRTRAGETSGEAARNKKPHERLLSYKIITLATLVRRAASIVYRRKLRLSQVEWSIIAIVGEHAPLSLNALADRMGLDKGQLSRVVAALVKRGLLNRGRRPAQRGIEITLSPRGSRIYEKLIELALRRNDKMLAQISERDRQVLFDALDKITATARRMLKEVQER